MVILNATVQGHNLTLEKNVILSSGSQKVDTIKLTFDGSWSGFGKEGVFWKGVIPQEKFSSPVKSDNTVEIPYNVLDESGTISISIRGVSGDQVITTKSVSVQVFIGTDNNSGSSTAPPDPTVYDQILSNLGNIQQSIENYPLTEWKLGYITINENVGEYLPMTRVGSSAWVYQIVPCQSGDKFHYEGFGGNASKGWAFCDKNFKLLSVTSKLSTHQVADLEAEEDGYLICNAATADSYSLGKTKLVTQKAKNKFDNIFPPQIPEYHVCISGLKYNKTTQMSYDEIMAGYDALVSNYPDYVKKTMLGNDTSGTIPMYRYDFKPEILWRDGSVNVLTHDYTQNDYPTIIMDASIHGSERPCAKSLLNLMTLIADAKENDIFGWLRSNIHFVIIPIANPWGYKNDNYLNSNGVNLNRNFPVYWEFGNSETSSDKYRGSAALSEKEAQYIYAILEEYQNNAICYYNWHTHGLFTAYNVMTCFSIPSNGFADEMQNVGYDVTKSITYSGWENHFLPKDSGLIGFLQFMGKCGMVHFTGASLGIASACPEVMYRYYDGGTAEVYNENTDAMNVEYMLYAVCGAIAIFRSSTNIKE